MGTPGMAFIRCGGQVKNIRSRYDGHIQSFGLGCASAIREMPPQELERLGAAFHMADGDDDEAPREALSPRASLAAYGALCEGRLGPAKTLDCSGLAPNQPTFGVPYVGLGPVLCSGAGPDCSDWGFDYGYLVDIDAQTFGLIHQLDEKNPERSKLLWSFSFDEIRSVASEAALDKAFTQIEGIDYDWESPDFQSVGLMARSLLSLASASPPDEPSTGIGLDEAAAAERILAIPDGVSTGIIPEPGKGRQGKNLAFSSPAEALFAKIILERCAIEESACACIGADSSFGFDPKGAPGGQICSRGALSPSIDQLSDALYESFSEAINACSHTLSSFGGGGWDLSPLPASMDQVGIGAQQMLDEMKSIGPEAVEQRWLRFDFTLAMNMPRSEWLPIVERIALDQATPPDQALDVAALAIGAADRQMLALASSSEPCRKAFQQAPRATIEKLASRAAMGIRLACSLSPKQALLFARELAAGPFDLAASAGSADAPWLRAPASCIMARRSELVEFLNKTRHTPPRFRGF